MSFYSLVWLDFSFWTSMPFYRFFLSPSSLCIAPHLPPPNHKVQQEEISDKRTREELLKKGTTWIHLLVDARIFQVTPPRIHRLPHAHRPPRASACSSTSARLTASAQPSYRPRLHRGRDGAPTAPPPTPLLYGRRRQISKP
jgi:hypothetical protein